MLFRTSYSFSAAAWLITACASPPASPDAGGDVALDVGAFIDSAPDAPGDSATDAALDAPGDTRPDASYDVNHTPQPCASNFGGALVTGFGRLDGTLFSVVRPTDQSCAMPNRNHLDLEVQMMGAVYRALITAVDTQMPADIEFAETDAALVGPAFGEGWHQGFTLDYANNLATHSTAFTPLPTQMLVDRVLSEVSFGDPIAIYMTAYGPDGGHNVHRSSTSGAGVDGAVVIRPTSATPHYLLFHFVNQSF